MEATKKCPYCGEEILATAKKCRYCGEWLEEKQPKKKKQIPCEICGEMIDEDADVCPFCHEKVKRETPEVDAHQAVADTRLTVDDRPAVAHATNANPEKVETSNKEEDGFFNHYFFDVITNHYADFKGTASRKDYWFFIISIYLLLSIISCFGFISISLYFVLYAIVGLGILLPTLSICVRRLRDSNIDWKWLFINIIPFIGTIIFLFVICQKGNKKNPVVKHTSLDYVIWIIGVAGIAASFSLMNTLSERISHIGDEYSVNQNTDSGTSPTKSSTAFSNNKELNAVFPENKGYCILSSRGKNGSSNTYLLKKNDNDVFEPSFYIWNSATGKKEFDLTDFHCGGEEISAYVINDYALSGNKIVFIADNGWSGMGAGYYVFFYDMSDDTFNYVDFGSNAEFVKNKKQLKVTHMKLIHEGSYEAENEYGYEDKYYDL